jgi:cytochrome c oxidase subunit II
MYNGGTASTVSAVFVAESPRQQQPQGMLVVMTTSSRSRQFAVSVFRIFSIVAMCLVLAGCTGPQSMFDPSGSGARSVDRLWLLMLGLGTAVFVVVLVLLSWSILSGRKDEPNTDTSGLSRRSRMRLVALGGVVVPIIILSVVLVATMDTLRDIAGLSQGESVVIDVVGHQFWWEVRYPDHDVVTANEIVIPVGEKVQVNLTSQDVIHAFWVPQISGKIDMMAGTTTTLPLLAEEAGTYRGQCAQFCGAQHANMAFTVIAVPPEEFEAWTVAQAAPANEPPPGSLIERGFEVYMSSVCLYCHRVSGTNSTGDLGPDLTHLASRTTLASGMLDNNTGNLAAWILDPQAIKPGNLMPGIAISGEDLTALLAYLESLD